MEVLQQTHNTIATLHVQWQQSAHRLILATHYSLHHGTQFYLKTYRPRELFQDYCIPSISAVHPNSLHCPRRHVWQLAYQHVGCLLHDLYAAESHARLHKGMAWKTLLWKDLKRFAARVQLDCSFAEQFCKRSEIHPCTMLYVAVIWAHSCM